MVEQRLIERTDDAPLKTVKPSRIRSTGEDLVFDLLNYAMLTVVMLGVLYPLYFIAVASVSEPNAVALGRTWLWVKDFTLDGYDRILQDNRIWTGYLNTIIYTVLGTAIGVTLTLTIAFPLSQKRVKGRNFVMILLVITLYFHGGLIPTYLLVNSLGLVNTRAAMVLVGAVGVWNVIIARTFFQTTIPSELYEAAYMDGCSDFRFFVKIVLPLSRALIAVLILFYGVEHWNEFFRALIYLRDENKYSLQLILREILISTDVNEATVADVDEFERLLRIKEQIKYGVIIVASLPVLVLYPLLQQYFVKGVMIGSLKG